MTLLRADEPKPPRPVQQLAERLEEAGYETWCVGGAVRDALLGLPHLDWDLATRATPDEVRRLFGRRRTVPVGVRFGTVGVFDQEGRLHEVTTFRRDVRTDGRHAEVEFGASLEEDLARRDFTINAIALSPTTGEIRDPFGGRADLERGIVRAVGVPEERMREDRLRALRAIRFAARFGFEIDPPTWAAIVDSAPHLDRLSAERVKQELEKTMEQVREPSVALRRWLASGAMRTLVPPLADLSPVALATVDRLPLPGPPNRPRRRLDRLAALFLDLEGREATRALEALRFSNADAAWIGALADRWRSLGGEMTQALLAHGPIEDARLRRWVAAIGRTRVVPFLRLAYARWCAMSAGSQHAPEPRSARALYRRAVRSAFRDAVELGDLAVDGDDLRRAGIPPGPLLGRILHELLDAVLAHPALNTPEQLVRLALERYRHRPPNSEG